MKPELKRLLLLFSAISAVIVIGLVAAFRSSAFDDYLKQKLIAAVAPQVRLDIGKFSLSGTTLELESVEAYLPQRLLGLTVDRVRLGVSIWSLLRGQPDITASLAAYGGTADLRAAAEGGGAIAVPRIELHDLDLASHPQISALGLDSGVLSLHGSGLRFAPAPEGGSVKIDLRDVALARDGMILRQLKIPGEFVPPIERGLLNGLITFDWGKVGSDDLRLSLGFANFRGSVAGTFDARGTLREFSVQGSVDLDPAGAERIGPFLPALSAGTVEASATGFTLSGSGTPKNPRWKVAPVK